MRELIYVSRRKLSQFVDDGRGGRRRRVHQFGATAPMGLGGLQVGLSESQPGEYARLADVVRHLEKTAAPKAFTDEEVRPGQWVRFGADMIHQVFRDSEALGRRSSGAARPGPPALLFWDPQQPDASDAWPTRLLLHGSPEHLVGAHADQTPTVDSRHTMAMSSPIGLVDFLTGLTERGFSQVLWFVLNDLDRRYPMDIAARVTGLARVTANVRAHHTPFVDSVEDVSRVVVASPLFVELAG